MVWEEKETKLKELFNILDTCSIKRHLSSVGVQTVIPGILGALGKLQQRIKYFPSNNAKSNYLRNIFTTYCLHTHCGSLFHNEKKTP